MLKQFISIFNKEFYCYFTTPTAYIVFAVYLVLSMFATFYSAYFFMTDNSSLISFFTYQPEILVVLMPAVTMRLWSDERHSGTIEFLLTQPISYPTLILGKYFAALALGIIMLCLTLAFVFYISFFIQLDKLTLLSGYLATILTITLLAALGSLISMLNTNAVLAYISGVFIGWGITSVNFDFVLAPILNLAPNISNLLSQSLNFYRNYNDMLSGQIGFENLAYFLLQTVLILWLNIVTINYKKL